MFLEQSYINRLAHASYSIDRDGEEIVVDSQRGVDDVDDNVNAHGHAGLPSLDFMVNPQPLHCDEMIDLFCQGSILLDVRPFKAYGADHIFGSLNIGLDGQFASWAGTLIPLEANIVVIADQRKDVSEAVIRLARVGFNSVVGFLNGGLAAWKAQGRSTMSTAQMSVDDLRMLQQHGSKFTLLDVRRIGEFEACAAADATSMPLDQLEASLWQLDRERPVLAICESGYRSSIATSLLELHGFQDPANVDGGMAAYMAQERTLLADVSPDQLIASLVRSIRSGP